MKLMTDLVINKHSLAPVTRKAERRFPRRPAGTRSVRSFLDFLHARVVWLSATRVTENKVVKIFHKEYSSARDNGVLSEVSRVRRGENDSLGSGNGTSTRQARGEGQEGSSDSRGTELVRPKLSVPPLRRSGSGNSFDRRRSRRRLLSSKRELDRNTCLTRDGLNDYEPVKTTFGFSEWQKYWRDPANYLLNI